MVITISCPSCAASFPVDPAKIPEAGVNVRCSQCSHVFRVERPAEPEPTPEPTPVVDEAPAVEAPEPEAPAVDEPTGDAHAWDEAPAEAAADDWVVETEDDVDTGMMEEAPSFDEPVAEEEPVEEAPSFDEPVAEEEPVEEAPSFDEPVAEEEPVEEAPAAPAVQGFSFGQRDPSDKAKRLARVLVSDMIMYNPERHEKALANGTLKEDFEEEIEKSFKEYVEQVGEDLADGTAFWTEALNDVLAKGESIF